MKVLRFSFSSLLFPIISFGIWVVMSKVNGGCPMKGLSFIDANKMKYLPLLILWNGVFFTGWLKWLSSRYYIKGWQFGIIAFMLTRYFHELYMYVDVKDYSNFLVSFGMIHGFVSTLIWAIVAQKILGNVKKTK